MLPSILCRSGQVGTRHYDDQLEMWLNNDMNFVPLGSTYKGHTTTVLRSRGTVLPTAGAARVEKKASKL